MLLFHDDLKPIFLSSHLTNFTSVSKRIEVDRGGDKEDLIQNIAL